MEEYISRLSNFKKPDFEKVEELTSAEYFYDRNAHMSTHEHLINDHLTMDTFRDWIEDNKRLIQGKIVLDVGCGTGLFSMLAARAGAARVISLEWSLIGEHTEKIINDNELGHIITVIRSEVENAVLPHDIKKVDVIISMWIGYSLFQGGRLKQLILARDKWLQPSGFIIPDLAELYISAISDDDYRLENIDWWKNVYGYDLSSVTEDALKYASYTILSPEKIITNKCQIKNLNLKLVSYNEAIKEEPFMLTAKSNDFVQGFCTFFTIRFSGDIKKREINTEPVFPPTHWGHTCFYVQDYFLVKKKEKIRGSFSVFGVNNDPRFLGIILGIFFEGQMNTVLNIKTFILRA